MLITPNLTNRSLEQWLVRHLIGSYYKAVIPNFYLGNYECDVISLNRSGYTAEYEIKQTKSDYYKDFEKKRSSMYIRSRNTGPKHDYIKDGKRTNRFWFVLPEDMDVEVPDYCGRMNYRFKKWYAVEHIEFVIVKQAPLLHKTKCTEDLKDQMLIRLNWKHFHLMMDLTKNYDKYQLNLGEDL